MMFKGLHIYTVHVKPGQKMGQAYPVFVREGFSVWAFLFTLLWSLYQRLWLVSALMLAYYATVATLKTGGFITEASATAVLLAMQVVVGFHANDWVRARLTRQGYITAGIATGENRLRAELRFFDQYVSEGR